MTTIFADKMDELPELKRLRHRAQENIPSAEENKRGKQPINAFKTPPSALKRQYNPLDYNNVRRNF